MDNYQTRFFVNTAGFHLGIKLDKDEWEKDIENLNLIPEFLGQADILSLYATIDKNKEKRIKFEKKIKISNGSEKVVAFYKSSPIVITEENMYLVQTVAVQGSPTTALYHAIDNVFMPLLSQNENISTNVAIQKQLTNLQSGLRNLANISPNENSNVKSGNEILTVIQNLDHECQFWKNKEETSANKDRQKYQNVCNIVRRLADSFDVLEALPLPEIEDVLENAHNNLDDLWRLDLPYPKARMQHLMDLISYELVRCLSKHVKESKVWSENFNTISETLNQCINIGEFWLTTCKQLTEIYWPNYSLHVWTGKPHVSHHLEALIERFKEVLNVRTVHRQIVRLLTASEIEDLGTNETFKPFEEVDYLHADPYSQTQWKTALKRFEYLFQPAEERVAVKLRKQLSDTTANTQQLLHECSRYCELINRPVVKKTLQNERQYLLSVSKGYIKSLSDQMTSDVRPDFDKYNISETVAEVINLKQLEQKVKKIDEIGQNLLNDLHGYDELKYATMQLTKEIKQQHSDLFDSWANELHSKIKNNSLSLKETEPVVRFSEDKMMEVNYAPQLLLLIREVRQLYSFGYTVPDSIAEVANLAKKFMKYARTLDQISNFHNTIGDRMIPSQRPMMLTTAVNLSKLVQDQEVVSWGEKNSIEQYIETLKKAVEKLSDENDLLTGYHNSIIEKIADLEDVDLIKQFQKWKDALRFIQNIVNNVQMKGFKNMSSWKVEIDQQLAAVLEKQYLQSLETLHLYLPEIQVDLAYRNSELQFSPPEDVLKEKYNQQLKRFIDLPRKISGVSETSSGNIFSEIVQRNENNLSVVNKHRENLFDQLQAVKKHWKSWLTLENLDVSKLNTWQHWDMQFRASKTFGQEIAKLPNTEERVGCFVVGLSWLRIDLENHNRNYWSQLTTSLKNSIAQDVFKLQEYVDSSTENLHKQLLTIEQFGEADSTFSNILKDKPEMEILLDGLLQKSKTLSSWTREQVDSVNRLQTAWDRLESLLENHEHIITRQIENLKITLNLNRENLMNDLQRFEAKWEQVKMRSCTEEQKVENIKDYLESIKEKRLQWEELKETKEALVKEYFRLHLEPPVFPIFDEVEVDLQKQENMWKPFESFYSELDQLMDEEWIVFRKKIYRLEEFLNNWETTLKKSENPSSLLLMEIEKYNAIIPTLQYLRGEYFTEKHWNEIFSLLAISQNSIDTVCLRDFLNCSKRVAEEEASLQIISKKAASEIVIRQALSELEQWDFQAKFLFIPHSDSKRTNVMLIKDFKEILNKIGDNQSLLQSVKNSSDYDTFSERILSWEGRLADLDRFVTLLAIVQRKWLYLEPIFKSGTLSQEKNRFNKIDKDFRRIVIFLEKELKVTSLLKFPNIRNTLENLQDQLAKCQHSLDNFLSEKRRKFPRFFFLSDDDLLEIVGQSSKENVIQSHLKKLFGGINSVELDADENCIIAMCSLQREKVRLKQPVDIKQPIEDWLNHLVKEMQNTLKLLLVNCLAEGDSADPWKYPSQILCLANNIVFTKQCEKAISTMSLVPLLGSYKAQLTQYSSLNFNTSSKNENGVSNESMSVLELKLKSLLMDTIHHVSVIEELIDDNVAKNDDWTWTKHLRFYSDPSGNVTVKMINAEFEYSYEYLGNQPKLVRTSLTDKCFLTLIQGMHLGMGGNPYGPAGTGKTETVKALGCLLGRQVLVFNCDETIDATSMGMILLGLVQCGAWGCFDEFNRMDEAALSTISMHIQLIQRALYNKQNTLLMFNQEIQVNKHSGIFVTLNPAGEGYGARNKLPDNLKQLFRPIVMTHPDQEDIVRTLLHVDGYKYAHILAKKIVKVYDLSSNLLSNQQHYDWGLRALKTVLSSCSNYLREYYKKTETEYLSLDKEMELAVESLKKNTLSRLTYADSQKFEGLIEDVFPKVNYKENDFDELHEVLKETYKDLGYEINERQLKKCIEFYEQLKQRMGVVLVGPSGSGKTTVRTLVSHAISRMGITLKQKAFNPKSMTKMMLLGQIDSNTRQWTEGVLTTCSLQVASEPLDIWSWIVCDGDIDPEWIEALNSVLDDNRLLSLPSGWQIKFGPNVNFVFETDSLGNASPATISRLGIVFLSEEDMNITNYVENYLSKTDEYEADVLKQYVSEYFYKAFDLVKERGKATLPQSYIAVAKTALLHVEGVKNKSHFLVGLLESLIPQVSEDYRERFVKQLFEWFGEIAPPGSSYFFHFDERLNYIENYNAEIDLVFSNKFLEDVPLVKTDAVNYTLNVMRKCLQPGKEQHFLLVGKHGSAKTLMIEQLVKERSDLELGTIHCSAYVTPEYITYKLSQFCMVITKSNKRIYKPNKGSLVLYFKNLQLLKNDQWGSNIVVMFLQQLITYKGFYDSNLEWIEVENVVIIGSLTPTDELSKRFTSLFNVYCIGLPSKDDLQLIFMNFMNLAVENVLPNSKNNTKINVSNLIFTMLNVFYEVQNHFLSSDYQTINFTPHDLSKWFSNIWSYKYNNEKDIESFLLEIIINEARSIFREKLTTNEDKYKFDTILKEINNKNDLISKNANEKYYIPLKQTSANEKRNELISVSKDDWVELIKKGIRQYENEEKVLNISITPEILHITSAIAKSLSKPKGNILLVGPNGFGRKSSGKIISTLQSAKLIVPTSSKKSQFYIDLKMAMQFAGAEGQPTYLLLEDFLLQNSENLSVINVLIQSGEVPGLFNQAELDSVTSGLKDESTNSSFDGNIVQFFTQRVLNNLHLIVCVDINNDDLDHIFQCCPALLQKCCIMWLPKWSEETMKIIPDTLIDCYNEKSPVYKVEKNDYFYEIQRAVEDLHFSPFSYVTFIRTYIDMYSKRKEVIISRQKKLQGGVSKLNEAKDVVRELKIKASQQQQVLSEKQAKANSALDMISNTMKNANDQKQEMEVLKQHTQEESKKLAKRKQEIEEELAEVKPLIEQARNAVGNIKTESLSEIRSLRAPPDVIRDILEGVLRLMGTQDTSWNSMKNFLSKRGVKEDIKSFDAGRILPENRQAVERLMNLKKDSFNPKIAKRASVAAAPLAAWVSANLRYSIVLENIKPLEKEQYKLQKNLENAEFQLEDITTGLTNVDTTVAKLKDQLSTYTREAAEIELSLRAAEETLRNAEGLVNKLTDEYERWKIQIERFSQDIINLPTNCLLASAFIVYLAKCDESDRLSIFNKWKCILKNTNDISSFSVENFLSSEREKLQWVTEGLSSDKLSIQNAIILLKSKLCPIVIDPSSQSVKWFIEHMRNKTVERVTQNCPKFITTVELAIRFGKILIVEEVDALLPVLYPILRKEFSVQGQRKLININGKQVDYHDDFSLIFVTRNPEIKLPADIKSAVNIIKFVTSEEGLSEQLLNSVVQKVSPDLEIRKKELLHDQEELQEKQIQLQDQLLEKLANSSGDILQNRDLIDSLNNTKSGSDAIAKALEESTTVKDKLQTEYDVYKEIADFGSFLYFSAASFSKTNVLYTLSIRAFTRLFLNSLQPFQDENNAPLTKSILLHSFYNFTSRGIFKSDRQIFAIFLVQKLFPKEIPENQWEIFLRKTSAKRNIDFEGAPKWVPKHLSHNIVCLQMEPELYKSLGLEDQNSWESFMKNQDCENHFPQHLKVTEFEKILIVQNLRPDRLISVLTNFIRRLSGLRSLHPEILQLSKIFKESVENEPILIITTSGNDPSSELKTLAEGNIGLQNYVEISLGEDEKDKVVTTLAEAAKLGHWLTLKNLHLVTSWLPLLCQTLQNVQFHKDFRLWLVTEYHKEFSPVLAQNCLKVVLEAPQGIKNNILRSFSKWGSTYVNKQNPTGSRILFILACIHALLQERRTYIPQGWSKWYEFSDSDLSTAVRLTEEIWKSQSIALIWKYLRGLCSDAIYGSRIENKEDFKILDAYLKQYLCDESLSHRWRPLGLISPLPSSSNFEEYVKVIQLLNNHDLPAYFGLPNNIEKTLEQNTSTIVISKLKEIYMETSSDNDIKILDIKEWQKYLAPYMSLWKKLNHGYNFIKEDLEDISQSENPLHCFILDEYKSGILLIQHIHKTFSLLNSIIKGNSTPNEKDRSIVRDLQRHKTPLNWMKIWKGSNDPLNYLKNVVRKVRKLFDWKSIQSSDHFFNHPIDLSYIFHPEGFIAVFKQHYARKNKIPIDELTLRSSFLTSPGNNSIILTGLLLEGALFDGHKLSTCESNSENLSACPDCKISLEVEQNRLDNYECLLVPLYSRNREKLLTFLQVPCESKERDFWVTTSIAFYIDS